MKNIFGFLKGVCDMQDLAERRAKQKIKASGNIKDYFVMGFEFEHTGVRMYFIENRSTDCLDKLIKSLTAVELRMSDEEFEQHLEQERSAK